MLQLGNPTQTHIHTNNTTQSKTLNLKPAPLPHTPTSSALLYIRARHAYPNELLGVLGVVQGGRRLQVVNLFGQSAPLLLKLTHFVLELQHKGYVLHLSARV